MNAAELRLFAASLRQAIERHDDLTEALTEVGWQSALAEEPAALTRVVFDLLGELNVTGSAIDDLMTYALGLEPSPDLTVILPRLASHRPPATYDRAELEIAGLATCRIDSAAAAIVVIDAGEQCYLTRVEVSALEVLAADGIDGDASWRTVGGHLRIGELAAARWADAVAMGQLALAQQITSASRVMLSLAREHATSRRQFGRPIGAFQAVRHKLAESFVALESAEAALQAGWAEPTPFTATMAKAVCGSSAKTVARHAQQVLAGMGFTSEHAFHRYLKRTLVLDQLLGSSARLRAEIGKAVVDSRQLPPLLPL